MKNLWLFIALIFLLSCKNKKHVPDISNIPIQLTTERFERDFFNIDTNHLSASLDTLSIKYPSFIKDYLYNILGALPQPDSVLKYVALYKKDYQFVNNEVQKKFTSFAVYQKQIENAFQFIHYYFPNYRLPKKIITFVGPLEGTANALTQSGIAIGLQAYLGKNFAAYQTQYISEIYPSYKSRRFEPEYIVVNCVKNIIDDMYPPKTVGKPLIEQMIEAGKRLYVIDAILPYAQDSLKTGYTEEQLKGCFKNERAVWTFFVENNLLFETEATLITPYINDGPNTPELGSNSPGFIGQFVGWQIVKEWMMNNKQKSLDELMNTDAKQIYNEAHYKP